MAASWVRRDGDSGHKPNYDQNSSTKHVTCWHERANAQGVHMCVIMSGFGVKCTFLAFFSTPVEKENPVYAAQNDKLDLHTCLLIDPCINSSSGPNNFVSLFTNYVIGVFFIRQYPSLFFYSKILPHRVLSYCQTITTNV